MIVKSSQWQAWTLTQSLPLVTPLSEEVKPRMMDRPLGDGKNGLSEGQDQESTSHKREKMRTD